MITISSEKILSWITRAQRKSLKIWCVLIYACLTANYTLFQQLQSIYVHWINPTPNVSQGQRKWETGWGVLVQEYEGMPGKLESILCKTVIILKSKVVEWFIYFIFQSLIEKVFIKCQWCVRYWSGDEEILIKWKRAGCLDVILLML